MGVYNTFSVNLRQTKKDDHRLVMGIDKYKKENKKFRIWTIEKGDSSFDASH